MEKKKDKLVNRRGVTPQPGAREVAGKIITHAAVCAVWRTQLAAGRELLTERLASGYSYASRAFNASTCALCAVPPPPGNRETIAFCGKGKGISAYMRHNTICDAPYVHLAVYATARQRARLLCGTTPQLRSRRLMENALLPLNAVLRLPTIRSHLSTARVEDLTRAFSRAHEDPNAAIALRSRLIALRNIILHDTRYL